MDKILVTTDFSSNSKAGLRFAIQLASQAKYELIFFHAYYFEKPTTWNGATTAAFEKRSAEAIQKKLDRFVQSVYRSMGLVRRNEKCVIVSSILTDSCILEYAQKSKVNFICISTRGASKLKKWLGTNTSYLINHAPVPVIAVPYNYRKKDIKTVLYASDLMHVEKELKKVLAFSKPLKAAVELLHFNYPTEEVSSKKIMVREAKMFSKHAIKVHLETVNLAERLVANIEGVVKKSKPSVMIMFTEQNRSFFDKIFLSSNAADYSFTSKVPLLVFNKA
ncbi:MAG: universal stress protein [Bacteroidetes bacterium]|nr:universal stress protein [Bacteroidota bacterium]